MDHSQTDCIALTTGVTLLTCVLARRRRLHAYASGQAQRQALVDRLSATGQCPAAGRRRHFRGPGPPAAPHQARPGAGTAARGDGLDITPGEFFVYMLATVARPVADRPGRPGPVLRPDRRAARHLGGVRSSSTGSGRNASRSSSTNSPSWPGSWPTPPRRASPCARRSGMAAEELEAPAGEELAKVADQLAVGDSIDDALGELAERLPSRELVVLVTTLVLSNRAGGPVVELAAQPHRDAGGAQGDPARGPHPALPGHRHRLRRPASSASARCS